MEPAIFCFEVTSWSSDNTPSSHLRWSLLFLPTIKKGSQPNSTIVVVDTARIQGAIILRISNKQHRGGADQINQIENSLQKSYL